MNQSVAMNRGNIKSKLWNVLQEFSNQTTIHGVSYFGAPKLHLIERFIPKNHKTPNNEFVFRVFWAVVVVLAAFGAIALSLSNWRRYSANPTVVSLRKDFRNWNNVFPSATACFLQRTNEQFAKKYISEYVENCENSSHVLLF